MRGPLSLKARALALLAQRDQSRVELRRKLLRHATTLAAANAGAVDDPLADSDAAEMNAGAGAAVDATLDWLEANRYLSVERFVESRIHAREARFGNLRIRHELAQHGVELPASAAQALAETEMARAAAVRARRFAATPETAAERAAQARFLAARGFSPEVVYRLLRSVAAAPRRGDSDNADEAA